ncbi:MAG: helix-turn-helix transcriptional regulator [Patescibacteria group bacterium]
MNKNNIFYKFQKDKEYQRYYKEASDMLEIAIQIAEARKKQKMTQVQLAKHIGMPQSQIARIESGNSNTTVSTLYKVLNALNLRLKLAN